MSEQGNEMLDLLMTKLEKIDDRVGALNDKLDAKMASLNEKLDTSMVELRKEVHGLQLEASKRQVICESRTQYSKELKERIDSHDSILTSIQRDVSVLRVDLDKSDWKIFSKTLAKVAALVVTVSGAAAAVYQFLGK